VPLIPQEILFAIKPICIKEPNCKIKRGCVLTKRKMLSLCAPTDPDFYLDLALTAQQAGHLELAGKTLRIMKQNGISLAGVRHVIGKSWKEQLLLNITHREQDVSLLVQYNSFYRELSGDDDQETRSAIQNRALELLKDPNATSDEALEEKSNLMNALRHGNYLDADFIKQMP